ncbi:MAG: sigma-70 family RNA polymerase sigma factor [Clostridia bacterium]|nr:sigma-70 family RNA polymerase sigma factor [Clostridia bacterium]
MTLNEACQTYYLSIYWRCLHALYYNDAQAEDVTQEVFRELCMQWDRLEKQHICAWLYKTADYMVLKAKAQYVRSRGKTVALDETYIENLPEQFELHEQMQINKIDADPDLYCEQVYAGLSDREKELLGYLRLKMKHADIARLMGTSVNAVTMASIRLYRKVKRLIQQVVDDI